MSSTYNILVLEIFKAFNKSCPTFIKDYFQKSENLVSKKYDLKIPIWNSVTFGNKSFRSLALQVWNSLPKQLKTETSYTKFKEEIDKWFGPKCKWSLCFLYKVSIKQKHSLKFDLGVCACSAPFQHKSIKIELTNEIFQLVLGIDPFLIRMI